MWRRAAKLQACCSNRIVYMYVPIHRYTIFVDIFVVVLLAGGMVCTAWGPGWASF